MGAITVNPVQSSQYDLTASANPITFGTTADIDTSNLAAVFGSTAANWTVTNRGKLQGGSYGVLLDSPSTVTNSGKISGTTASVEFAGSGANTLTLQTGSVLTGNAVGSRARGATNALMLQGTGTANNDFVDFNTLNVAASAVWTLGGDTLVEASGGTGSGTNAGMLAIANGATLGLDGTFVNSGSIALDGSTSATTLEVDGATLTLTGDGKVTLSDSSNNAIASDGSASTLTNVNNTIAGAGTIGDPYLTLDNAAVIDADAATALVLHGSITNTGTLESTGSGGLDVESNVTNKNTIAAMATNADVVIDGVTISNTGGLVLALGTNAKVEIENATIEGGTVEASGAGAVIEATSTGDEISNATVAAGSLVTVEDLAALTLSGGTIGAGAIVEALTGGVLIVTGTIASTGTLFASGANSLVDITGSVDGGTAEVGNGTVDIAGPSSENVSFQAGGTGELELQDTQANPTDYAGAVSGFGQNDNQVIDLGSVTYVAGAYASYAPNATDTGGVLTITDNGVPVAEITLVGTYWTSEFTVEADGSNHVEIIGSTSVTGPATSTFYLTVGGVDGGSTTAGHVGAFQIADYSLDTSISTTGKPTLGPVVVDLSFQSGLPQLFEAVSTGQKLTMEIQDVDIDNNTLYELLLNNVAVTGLTLNGPGGTDQITLDPGTVQVRTSHGPPGPTPGTTLTGGDATASAFYLTVGGVDGGSTTAGHVGAFQIADYTFGMTNAGQVGGSASESSTTVSLVVDLSINSGLPDFFKDVAGGAVLTSVEFQGVNSSNTTVYELLLTDAVITGLTQHGGPGGTDQLTFDASKIQLATSNSLAGPTPGTTLDGGDAAASTFYLTVKNGTEDLGATSQIVDYTFDTTNAGQAGGSTSKSPPTFSLVVDLSVNSGLFPLLLLDYSDEASLTSVELHGVQSIGGQPTTDYDLLLQDVKIAGLTQDGRAGTDQVTFDAGEVAMTTWPLNANGTLGSPVQTAWNTVQNPVSAVAQSANIALLGNYMASSFVTAADGAGGTPISEASQAANQQPLLTEPHA